MPLLLKETLLYLYLFLTGAALGSFYYTLYKRILYFFYSKERKNYTLREKYYHLFFKPSFCYVCKNPIPLKNLLPVAGFFLSKGKCPHCRSPISLSYLLWEVTGGILLPYFYFHYRTAAFLTTLLFFQILLIGMIDYSKLFIDPENLAVLLFIEVIYVLLTAPWTSLYFWQYTLMKTGLFSGIFALLYFFSKGKKLGFGDVLLVSVLSFYFDFGEMIAILILSSTGSILYILFYKKNLRSYAPLGFFLSLASVTVLFTGPFVPLSFPESIEEVLPLFFH